VLLKARNFLTSWQTNYSTTFAGRTSFHELRYASMQSIFHVTTCFHNGPAFKGETWTFAFSYTRRPYTWFIRIKIKFSRPLSCRPPVLNRTEIRSMSEMKRLDGQIHPRPPVKRSLHAFVSENPHINLKRHAMHVSRNNETRSRNHCCRRKAIRILMCVCSLSYPPCKEHAPYYRPIVICGLSGSTIFLHSVWLYHIFPHYLLRGTTVGKHLLNTKCVFWFSPQLRSENFSF
jgi:hypothetical protein